MAMAETGKKQGMVGKGRPPKDKQFKPGQSGNPNGRPVGHKNFTTLFDEAIKKIVEEGKIPGMTDPEKELVTKAIVEGLKGNYPYFRDLMDRRYGQPIRPVDITTGGQSFLPTPEERAKAERVLKEIE